VVDDLKWFHQHVATSSGICVFKATDWLIEETDLTAYGDVSAVGMGFYFHELSRGTPAWSSQGRDFLLQMHSKVPKWLAVYSDNSNTVDIFSS
jgi:hypothetical protein